MKKLAVLSVVLVSTAAWAAPGGSNASPTACFGQDRAAYAHMAHAFGLPSVGFYASSRKGENAAINAAYRDSCQP